ncbi:DNA-directed RNA polymerase subunit beta [Candidatus Nasuia deltocephalinicola]|uniref:DNA-directed RNA polymerase subunit beta n=1 Tax=Candidatus Nasuia deltocephalincola TaxID=1160784 RepID=UPI00216B062F|nr:DNA-directed RNA polymerase subunit beta [Candidatus Nasuia deltocephalinicola]
MNKIYNTFFLKNLSENYKNNNYSNYILKNSSLLYILHLSYNNFLKFGLKNIFNNIFPIYIKKSKNIIDFLNYKLIYPKKSYYYCINKGITYSISIELELVLYSYTFDNNGFILKNKIKSDFVNIFNIPTLTNNSTFIVDGVEKTIVSKFTRSPGLYFLKEFKKKKYFFFLKLVPDKGDEIDFFINENNIIYLKVRKNNILITDILIASGFNKRQIINLFYNSIEVFFFNESTIKLKFNDEIFLNYSFAYDIFDDNENLILSKNKNIDQDVILKIKNNNINYILLNKNFLIGKHFSEDLYYKNFKLIKILDVIDLKILNKIFKYNIENFKILMCGSFSHMSVISTLKKNSDYFKSLDNLNIFLKNIGFNIFDFNILNFNYNDIKKNFDISKICRKKLNFFYKKNYNFKLINKLDIINILKLLISFNDGIYEESDNLDIKNLNLLLVGDMVEELFFKFFFETKKRIENFYLNINSKFFSINKIFKIFNLTFEIKKFFSTSRYSQFLDQTNLISELSHKRKVTFLGVIGISKKYSGFNVRDLSSSHYSRICPIETPEGINIGLVNSLALLCKVDKYNFLVSPYYKVVKGKVLKKIIYLSVDEEYNSFICEPTTIFKKFKNIDYILSKYGDQIIITNPEFINFINILPYQMLSVSTILIPFLENNDSNRALMASNMLKQTLPLIFPERPYISTGLEFLLPLNSDSLILSREKGFIYYQDSRFIILKNYLNYNDFYSYNYDIYFLIKYFSSNQKTNKSQRIIKYVNSNHYVGDILIDGSCSTDGVLSLGKNVVVALMPWGGFNFEDSIIVSEKIIIDEKFTSLEFTQIDINILNLSKNEFEILSLDTVKKFSGKKNLDSFFIIKNGSKVYGGDVLIGKMFLKLKKIKKPSFNEKIINSVLMESNCNIDDTSFYLPNNFNSGIVNSVDIYFSDSYFSKNYDKKLFDYKKSEIIYSKKKKITFLKKKIKNMVMSFLIDKKYFSENNNEIKLFNFDDFKKKNIKNILSLKLVNCEHFKIFKKIIKKINFFLKINKFIAKEIKKSFFKELLPDISKVIRILIISKKNLQVGDKMSGRYGNKGVISKILPVHDMPYFYNGKIIDVILNPLGIPSRMNIGQLLEIHLGFASLCLSWKLIDMLYKNNSILNIKFLLKKIYKNNLEINYINLLNYKQLINLINYLKEGFYFSVKPFSLFKENDLNNLLNIVFSDNFLYNLGVSENKKQIYLYDGKSGIKFKKKVTVGYMYFFKLNHLSEDKIHARSTGPYSLITQQPLRGKTNKGGQRLGEMEVWALEAYGAFYSLQEMLTIKSDDVFGRYSAYKKIVCDIGNFNFNIPETFNVMMRNINSLSLYIRFNDC